MLISALAAGIADLRATPFSPVTPGIQLHANVIDGLLAGRMLRATGAWRGADGPRRLPAGGASTARLRLGGRAAATAGAGVALRALVCWTLSPAAGCCRWCRRSSGLALTWGGVLLLRALTAERERRWLRDAFGHYLAPTVLERVAARARAGCASAASGAR